MHLYIRKEVESYTSTPVYFYKYFDYMADSAGASKWRGSMVVALGYRIQIW